MRTTLSIAVGAAALASLAASLGGCGQRAVAANGDLELSGSNYCAPFKSAGANAPSALGAALSDPAAAFDDCIHRWGYTLAPARDPADVVAQATVNACAPILASWSQQMTSQDQAAASPARYRGQTTSQETPSPEAQRIRMAESRALFYVVQARAGGCKPPPANTLLASNGPG